ncbi:ligase-associated DNA damage response endonuclease PdeM [Deminuibacter soli]|uniref:Ligase-associated DNA damage response endonuclease PdeM n=1 Tax=Deminuibacter soli TaxID=2291815 RepID=A0A3E1NL38_9BACT|nr:ligase-associated DNA damage response endonuclease PdeM [Deminuibacter soli]RFM28632.1 ligase-associated DNA damage response endonuclease PdeM [Deminuibacter soli]
MFLPVSHHIRNNTFWLSSERCIYWEQGEALIVSDLHIGKTGHFRKAGIAVPQAVLKHDLQRLFNHIQHYRPKELIIVGDLFHSRENLEMDLFIRWRNDLPGVQFTLVKGNHDILPESWYGNAGISTVSGIHTTGGLAFTHDPVDSVTTSSHYTFTGHLHPGVRISGMGRQTLSFPCYYFGEQYAVLPAFSQFTGLAHIEARPNDKLFAIVNQSVIAM